jgi:Septation protein etd1
MFEWAHICLTPQSDTPPSPNLSFKLVSRPLSPSPQSLDPPSNRVSLSPSEPASTTFGSENEQLFSSGDEDSMEFQSDTAYDSMATRTTVSSESGLPGSKIETMFDEPPIDATKDALLPLEDNISPGPVSDSPRHNGTHTDDFESLSTPGKDPFSHLDPVEYLATPSPGGKDSSQLNNFPSSPPPTPFARDWQPQHDSTQPNTAIVDCPTIQDDNVGGGRLKPDSTFEDHWSSPRLPQHSSPRLSPSLFEPSQPPATQQRQGLDGTVEEKRLSIFDWSEPQRSDRDSVFGSSPRPRTVHGKHGNDGRGGRAPGRRAPNALHLRSQSVPAAKESHMDSDPAFPPAKFGTWGLGNKGVSEEWTDDFEFDELDDTDAHGSSDLSAPGMKVPQAIIDRQASVHGQFGQVQEFMLLVQELKRLRVQGSILGLLGGSSCPLWEEAEGIINLATLDEEEEELELALPRSPMFPTSLDDFDEDSSPVHRFRQPSITGEEVHVNAMTVQPPDSRPATPPSGRPRGESLAQAKTILQTMHQNRVGIDSSPAEARNHPPKLPFDTQDLRDLVTRTGVVTRALKDIVRKAEGVSTTPERIIREPQDPPFSQIFNRPENTSPPSPRPGIPKSQSVNSYMGGPLAGPSSERDVPVNVKMMAVI